ncbi:MAG: hypothetical protein K2H61_07550 [Muribaculaceae bacterium]|nr:hypothetical protein [Muribaculaceae bacterium]
MSQLLPSNILIDKMVAAGYERATAELIVNEAFRLISETLQSESIVRVKGLGEFVFTERASVAFMADEDLAKAINEPFSMFDPIELDETIDDVDLSGVETEIDNDMPTVAGELQDETPITDETDSELIAPIDKVANGNAIAETSDEELRAESTTTQEAIATPSTSESNNVIAEESIVDRSETATETETVTETDQSIEFLFDDEHEERKSSRNRTIWLLLILLLGLVVGYFVGAYQSRIIDFCNGIFHKNETAADAVLSDGNNPIEELTDLTVPVEDETSQQAVENTECNQTDSSEEISETPNTEPEITETVKPGNFLATMARRHYGRYEFWVYIYKENESKLGHPDLIESGTEVIIPPASKYGIDKSDPSSLKKAEQLATEIYAKF